MNENIGIGILVGIATGTTLYVWNSDSFTKPQKIGLICSVVFPPMQWILILLVLAFNKHQSEKTSDTKTIKQNLISKQNFDSAKKNLIELKLKGIITEEEFNTKVDKIERQKTEFDVYNSTEYKQLKSLFDSGILTKEEFDSKKSLIKETPIKKVNVEESERIKEYVENIKEEPKEENSNNKFNYLAVVVAVILLTIFIISQYVENNIEQNNDSSVSVAVDSVTTGNNINNNIQKPQEEAKIFVYGTVDYKYFEPEPSDNGFSPKLTREGKACTPVFEINNEGLSRFKQKLYSSVEVQHYSHLNSHEGFGYLTYPETVNVLVFTTMDEATEFQMKNCSKILSTFVYF